MPKTDSRVIWLDKTSVSIVVKCTLCPWYSGFADTDESALKVAAGHEQRQHPERRQARGAYYKHNERKRNQ